MGGGEGWLGSQTGRGVDEVGGIGGSFVAGVEVEGELFEEIGGAGAVGVEDQ